MRQPVEHAGSKPVAVIRPWVLGVLVATLYGLHQDVWNWHADRPLWFGFLPPGLTYHAAYTLAAALLMAGLVRWAWPARLERIETGEDTKEDGSRT